MYDKEEPQNYPVIRGFLRLRNVGVGGTPLRCGGSEQAHNLVILKIYVNAEECWSGGKAGHRANLSK